MSSQMAELFSYGPKTARDFLKKNLVPILYTIIFHLVIIIILIFVKIEGLKHEKELGIMLDMNKDVELQEKIQEENIKIPADWLEQILEARKKASNRAVNLNDPVNEKISTEEYVDELLDELESQKDEEFLKNREKWKDIISSYVFDEENKPDEEKKEEKEDKSFTGPTRITYEFLEPPLKRQKRFLSIPVYRCEGSGLVVVDLEVKQDGSVAGAKVVRTETASDPICFNEAAKKAAYSSIFRSDFSAPEKQKARITYQFVAQ